MNTQKYTLENIKNQAKKIKRQQGITHAAALDLVSRNLGFANWIHCQRSINNQLPIPEISPAKIPINFNEWLKRHKNRDSPLGDLSQDMIKHGNWPLYGNLEEYRTFLLTLDLPMGASESLQNAWKSYKAYLRRIKMPNTERLVIKKSITEKEDIRRVVIVKNAKPIHINNRTVEDFNPGDLAWISWDGRKASPVTIVEVDERHYTFRVERPLKMNGSQYFLFKDEVRSTPELACANRVTS